MTDNKSWVSCKEAAQLTAYSERHILNLIHSGKISAEKDETGKFTIQKAELFRAYPEAHKREMERINSDYLVEERNRMLEEKINHLKELLELKKEQNNFLTEQFENSNAEKAKMLEAINSHTKVLEFKAVDSQKSSIWRWPFRR